MPTDNARPSLALLMLASTSLWLVDVAGAAPLDQLSDLTGKATAVITLKGRDHFTSEYQYEVSVRNNSADALVGDSLVVVLDKVINVAGEDREPLKNEPILSRMEIRGQEGETEDGKPYFRIPLGSSPDLAPHAVSQPTQVRIRNKDYVAVFTPSFRVYGIKRQPPKQKSSEAPPQPTNEKNSVDKLIQLLIQKGVLTEEEWRAATQP